MKLIDVIRYTKALELEGQLLQPYQPINSLRQCAHPKALTCHVLVDERQSVSCELQSVRTAQ